MVRRTPGEGTRGESVILTLSDGELFLKIIERKELMGSIKLLIVFAVAALHFTVVPWGERTNQLMLDSQEFSLLVNSEPLSVWTHSMAKGNFLTQFRIN